MLGWKTDFADDVVAEKVYMGVALWCADDDARGTESGGDIDNS